MHAHDDHDHDQFAPPRAPARLRAIVLAVLVHAVLIGALTWGVHWKNSADTPAVEAQLWAVVPEHGAAPAPQPVTPPPQPQPVTPPPPPPRAEEEPDTRVADMAIEREKKRLEQERKRKEEERRNRLEQEERQQKAQREQQLAEQKKAEQDKQKKLVEDRRKAEAEARQLAELREANLRRIQGMAAGTTGSAQRSAGPSGSYGDKVAAKVRSNIVYPDALSGNPRAVVEVRAAPEGSIVGKRLIQSSGNKAWDEAVLRALDKTETLPRDVDGRVPPALEIGFQPRDSRD
ncbi:protein TolA [Verminephrobacter aporrectodeae subsp. tuberculatae]|uniref:TonB C-terminal domain-containing protein n=1 Tax=Verminephrobacter aporrectodeae TaxID=1110389 RepID=UPI002243D7E6|nr:TonB C-terminal domain-containing protein [Verminephrobacter aporrectodeae]MCW8164067.1 protein TolA [Verminephrobacter aporrectodeae subsp. tuberculatae]MCW8168212.1 protein TolA [Verminephrobacter aporrectodeae subsp. tuberculatae]